MSAFIGPVEITPTGLRVTDREAGATTSVRLSRDEQLGVALHLIAAVIAGDVPWPDQALCDAYNAVNRQLVARSQP